MAFGLRLGGSLFRHRGWLPVPFLVGIVAWGHPSPGTLLLGMALSLPCELLRLWAARSIGPASRTRGETPGPLALAGPYRLSRNPLYVANIALYACFALASAWLPAALLPLLAMVHYHFIVRWEEQRLLLVHGEAYRALQQRVPRWLGRPRSDAAQPSPHSSWSAALRAERGTLAALLAIFGGLTLRMLSG
jgi:protein-S-isoprenylcysteine O-methyltransferase Ste14